MLVHVRIGVGFHGGLDGAAGEDGSGATTSARFMMALVRFPTAIISFLWLTSPSSSSSPIPCASRGIEENDSIDLSVKHKAFLGQGITLRTTVLLYSTSRPLQQQRLYMTDDVVIPIVALRSLGLEQMMGDEEA